MGFFLINTTQNKNAITMMLKMNLFFVVAAWVALLATVSVSAKDQQGLRGGQHRDLQGPIGKSGYGSGYGGYGSSGYGSGYGGYGRGNGYGDASGYGSGYGGYGSGYGRGYGKVSGSGNGGYGSRH